MSMVRIVRADQRATSHTEPCPLASVGRLVKSGELWCDGFYQVEFVEPAPLFDVVTYRVARTSCKTVLNSRVPLTVALALALAERAADESSGNGRKWRTVVRAAR